MATLLFTGYINIVNCYRMTMPLIGVVVFAVVLTALGTLQCEAATEYYVRPSHVSDTSCPGEPCLTWTEYVSHTDQYFHSNTTFWFMPGTHHMNMSLRVSNVSNIVLMGLRDLSKVIGNISCADTPCRYAGFTINNATNITLKMLSFSIYLRKNNTAKVGGLSFFNVSSLHIEYCNVSAVHCHSAINITYSTHVKLNHVHVLNTHCNGIYFLNTTYSSIADCIIHSKGTGISLLNSSTISVMNSFLTGSNGVKMYIKSTTNSSVTNVIVINIKNASLIIYKATNITVRITTMISPHSSSNTANLREYVIRIMKSKMVYLYNVTYSTLRVDRCQNVTLGSTELSGNQGRKIYFGSSQIILFHDCHFKKFVSLLPGLDVTEQPAVIEMYNNSAVTFSNSSFEGNKISCLKLVDTNFTVNGTLTFKGNRAYRGAAIIFIQNSVLMVSRESIIEFLHNKATTTGGAIHIVSSSYYVPFKEQLGTHSPCFLEVKAMLKTARLIFNGNSASQGGDALYGGSLGVPCSNYSSKRSNKKNKSCLQLFNDISTISPKGLSRITSDPSRLCFCEDGSTECLSFSHSTNFMVHSGQHINISAGVVGQNFGTVAGSVHAHFLSHSENSTVKMTLGEKEQSQVVRKCECRNLTYIILSNSKTTTRVVLVLTAVNKQETQLIPRHKI